MRAGLRPSPISTETVARDRRRRPGRVRRLETGPKGFIWSTNTFDCSSNTGSSVFDFEGKDRRTSSTATSASSASTMERPAPRWSKSTHELHRVRDASRRRHRRERPRQGAGAEQPPLRLPRPWIPGRGAKLDAVRGPQGARLTVDKWVTHDRLERAHVSRDQRRARRLRAVPRAVSWGRGSRTPSAERAGQGVFSSPDLSICEVKPQLANCMQGQATVSATVYNAVRSWRSRACR